MLDNINVDNTTVFLEKFPTLLEIHSKNTLDLDSSKTERIMIKDFDSLMKLDNPLHKRHLHNFRINCSDKELLKFANYINTLSDDEFASCLFTINRRTYPSDISNLIERYERTSHEFLQESILSTLQSINKPEIRELSLRLLASNNDSALVSLRSSAQQSDVTLLNNFAKKNSILSHEQVSNILRIIDSSNLIDSFNLLNQCYFETYCSVCRKHAVELMIKYESITHRIIEECLHDSNLEIRDLVKKI